MFDEDLVYKHKALSKCKIGATINAGNQCRFLKGLLLYEKRLLAYQNDIRQVWDQKYYYKLLIKNKALILVITFKDLT